MPRTRTKPEEAPEQAQAPDADASADGKADDGEIVVMFVDELPADTEKSQRDSKYARALETVEAHPDKWAQLHSAKNRNGARTTVYQLRKKFPRFEWKYVNTEVYARFVPPAESSDEDEE